MSQLRKQLPTFVPDSNRADDFPEITLGNAERFPAALAELGDLALDPVEPVPIDRFATESTVARRFGELVRQHRADKIPCLQRLHGQVLSVLGPERPLCILEIGIGTVDPDRISHAKAHFEPGGSLRAFRDLCPRARIFGADVDRSVLFTEDRIRTAWVDQLEPESFEAMHRELGAPGYDLVIDDGLHAVSANLNTLLFALRTLLPGGFVVIEDLWGSKVCWKTVHRLLPEAAYERTLVACPVGSWAFVVRKRKGASGEP